MNMSKNELIEAITSVNKSATRDFLSEFGERELYDYVRQLESVSPPVRSGQSSVGNNPADCAPEPQAV